MSAGVSAALDFFKFLELSVMTTSPEPGGRSFSDVRMRGFAERTPVEDALRWLDQHVQALESETVPLSDAAGRILASDVTSHVDVPGFDRAMMDGFALRAADTLGASSYNPLSLSVRGDAFAGHPFEGVVRSGQAVRIMTGAPVPDGADAVLPVEKTDTDPEDPHKMLAQGETSPGKHVGRRGEDVAAGSTVLRSGRRLRPQDLGVLSSVGMAEVAVVRRPLVRLIVTGDELLPAGTPPKPNQTVDANSPVLEALITRDGGLVAHAGILPDDPQPLRDALLAEADVLIVSGGTSVGQEDHVPRLLAELGELAVHGIAMRPSSPTGLGRIGRRFVFLLPGNPVSCLCAYDFFAGRTIRALGGRSKQWPYATITAALRRKLVSVVGRLDYARVALVEEEVEPLAISGAANLSSTTRADGFVIIPADSEGHPAGARVEVFLYDRVSSP